jgi:glycosyltransferase involved in cell wall biosynthesis
MVSYAMIPKKRLTSSIRGVDCTLGPSLTDSRLILCVFSALISLVVAVEFLAALRRTAWQSPPTTRPVRNARLAVIIPARNEEQDLAQTLQSVLRQEDVELEVIVVNDHSTDRSGAIADRLADADPRLKVIHDPVLSPGWLGKCNAMQKGMSMSSADVLLFMDADIEHQPRCFVTALAEMERLELDFLSLFPQIRCISLWENAILPSLIGAIAMFATPRIEDPRSPDALAAGAFLMMNARVFHTLGDFETIKHEMLDDVALARLFKRNGRRVGFRLAPKFLSVRLYKGNHHAFWGMTKNILEGLNGRFWLAPAVIFLPVLVFWAPVYCGVSGAIEGDLVLVTLAATTYALQYAMIWSGKSLFQFQPVKALLFPLVAIPVLCCMVRALYLYLLRGAVEWRGRTIRVREARNER